MQITTVWDRHFRAHGRFIAEWPVVTVAIAYLASLQCGLGWTRLGTVRGVAGNRYNSEVWAPRDWPYYDALVQVTRELDFGTHMDWSAELGAIAMYMPQEEYAHSDLIDEESFQEMWDAWSKWYSISVVTSRGNEYSTHDLCYRSPFPDGVGFPVYPCVQVSVFDCFNDTMEFLHPSYKAVDETQTANDPTFNPYHLKPTWRGASPATLKQVTSACNGFQKPLVWNASETMPTVRMENGTAIAGNIFFHYQLYDAPKRGAWRLKYAKGGMMTKAEREADFREAKDMHSRVWENIFFEREKTSTRFWYAMWRNYEQQILHDMEVVVQPEGHLYVIGMALIWCFQLTLLSFRYSGQSRLQLSLFGNFLVVLSTTSGMGLLLRCGFDLSPMIVASLPFLSVGVGYDDVFVIMFGISEIDSAFFESNSVPTIMGELMARVGRGVTLSSACTCIAFGLGTTMPILIVSDFCMGVVMCSFLNWFHMMTSFGVAVVCEITRMKQQVPEAICCPCQLGVCCCCCPTCASCSAEAEETTGDWAYGFQKKTLDFLYTKWAPLLAKPAVAALVFGIGLAGAGTSIWPIVNLQVGTRQGYAAGGSFSDALEGIFTYSRAVTTMVALNNVDVPAKQLDILDLMGNLTSSPWSTPKGSINFVSQFRTVVQGLQAQAITEFQGNPAAVNLFNTMHPHLTNNDLNDPSGMDAPVTRFDPTSNTTTVISPSKRDWWYQTWHDFVAWPEEPADALDKIATQDLNFIIADAWYVNEFLYHSSADPRLARLRLSVISLPVVYNHFDDFTKTIGNLEAILRRFRETTFGPDEVFVATAFWSAIAGYNDLEELFWKLFAIDIAVIFVVTAILLGSVIASCVTSLVCAFVVMEVLAMSLQVFKFNPFMLVVGLAAMGIAVEDIAHIVCTFIIEPGTVQHRLGNAMRATVVPTYQGSFSTFLGLIPIALASAHPYALEMQFYPFCMIIIFGFTNGMLIAPAFCSLLSNVITLGGRKEQMAMI